MSKLLFGFLIVSTFILTACQTTAINSSNTGKDIYNNWVASCNSKFKRLSNNTFYFEVEKGEVGGCSTDSKPTPEGTAKFSERAEVKSYNVRLPNGNYRWSATIDIDRPCLPAQRNEIFQIHDGGREGAPPSQLGIEKESITHTNGTFKTNQHSLTFADRMKNNATIWKVPNRPFNIIADITIKKDSVKVKYFINGEEFKTTFAPRERTGKVFVKFGSYRINSNCTYKATYYNVNFIKIN